MGGRPAAGRAPGAGPGPEAVRRSADGTSQLARSVRDAGGGRGRSARRGSDRSSSGVIGRVAGHCRGRPSAGRTFDGVGALSAGASSRLLIDYPRAGTQPDPRLPVQARLRRRLTDPEGRDRRRHQLHGRRRAEPHAQRVRPRLQPRLRVVADGAGQGPQPEYQARALAWGAPGWVGNGARPSGPSSSSSTCSRGSAARSSTTCRSTTSAAGTRRASTPTGTCICTQALASHGYASIQVVADDSFSWTVAGALQNNPAFADSVDVVGQHYVCGYLGSCTDCPSPAAAQDLGKPLWASEQGSEPVRHRRRSAGPGDSTASTPTGR